MHVSPFGPVAVTVDPGSAEPGPPATVELSEVVAPSTGLVTSGAVGAVVSTSTVTVVAGDVLPATSVAATEIACPKPSAKTGTKLQL